MTPDERINQLSEHVRRLEQRCRRIILLGVLLLVGLAAMVMAYTHFGRALGRSASANTVIADHLVVRTIDLVNLEGDPMCHIYAHKSSWADGIELGIRSEKEQSKVVIYYHNGKANMLWEGAADGWKKRHEIGKP